MFPDEYREDSRVDELRRQLALDDPEQFYDEYAELTRAVTAQKRRGKEWAAERKELKRRVSSAHAALEILRDENKALRKKLEEVRSSRTMRLGRLVAKPYVLGRTGIKSLVHSAGAQVSAIKESVTAVQPKTARPESIVTVQGTASEVGQTATNPRSDGAAVSGGTRKRESQTDSLLEAFDSEPTAENLFKAINHLWYREYEISRPAQLVRSNLDLVKEADERTMATIRRIQGAESLIRGELFIPDRSDGAAYLVEPSRLMYCVHSTPVFNSNGYSTRTRGVAKGLHESGRDVVVVARGGYPWDSATDTPKPAQKRFISTMDGLEYVHTPGPNLNRDNTAFYIEEAADSYVREAKMLRPSIIMAASNHRTALPALIAARRLGVPFIYEVRGLWEITQASSVPEFQDSERFAAQVKLETIVANEADAVLAITEGVAEVLVQRGISREKIALAPNAVDTESFMPLPVDMAFAQEKKIDSTLPTIGFAGSLVDYEGLNVLLDASKLLQHRGVKHQLVIAGSGKAENELKEQATSLGLENVRFLGRVPQDDIVRLMSVFDIVACPRVSNQITELVSPLKPLESFGTATATVLSSVSPNISLAGDKETGMRARLVEPGDSVSLANALESLIDDEDGRRELARAGRLWVVKNRQWKMIGKEINSHLRSAEVWHSEEINAERFQLSDLKVALIADEFTTSSLRSVFDTVVLSRSNWKEDISDFDCDLLFVESAWEGNGGQWNRGVGYYSEEESEELRDLIGYCRSLGIPTVFWNKEDPVHFNRFSQTSEFFDHVFTTDANMVRAYRKLNGSKNKVVASHSFYAHPELHNPLPGAEIFHPTVAYAGTFYGDRYKKRSEQLLELLEASEPYGLDIFDRQANTSDSPYQFPAQYRKFVKGALPYSEVIETYKSQFVHLNVNSVESSPTMFSRRVVEIPASGGVVLSGPGRGVQESLGSNIPVVDNESDARALLHDWAKNPNSWLDERWRQMRTIFRSHTSLTELTVLVRAIGIPVSMPVRPTYKLVVDTINEEITDDILSYSRLPTVIEADVVEQRCQSELEEHGIYVRPNAIEGAAPETDWTASYMAGLPRTFYEDLLLIAGLGDWETLRVETSEDYQHDELIVETTKFSGMSDLVREGVITDQQRQALIRMPIHSPTTEVREHDELSVARNREERQTVLIAGHDLKFLGSLVQELSVLGHNVFIDKWTGHNQHDEKKSLELLSQADVIFCEWGLGNAVWYSHHVTDNQRLVVRIHLQELVLPYLKKINQKNVDKFIMVGELVRRAAVESHGLPVGRSTVIFNGVNVAELDRPKLPGASKTLGFVGMTPQRKRIDLALDLLELLLANDQEYRLRVKGKTPSDYPWMKNREDELAWYETQLARAEEINTRFPGAVVFDGFGNDMAEWYRNIGIAISTSDFESFHFTVADGAASGAMPISFNWNGADLIYPVDWLVGGVEDMARKIIENSNNGQVRLEAKRYVRENFDQDAIFSDLAKQIMGAGADE